MKKLATGLGALAIAGGLVGVARRSAADSTQCSNAACNTHESCIMKGDMAQAEALQDLYSDKALMAKLAAGRDLRRLNSEMKSLLQAFKPPDCAGTSAVTNQTLMATGDDCKTIVTYNGGEMPAQTKDGSTNPDIYLINACRETIDAQLAHEKVHQASCKAHGGLPTTGEGALADDAAAYGAQVDTLQAKIAGGAFHCTPTQPDVDAAKKFLRDTLTSDLAAPPPPPPAQPGRPPPGDPAANKKANDEANARSEAARKAAESWWPF